MGEVKVHVPVHEKCKGFTWYGAKMWNWIPVEIREMKNPDNFKDAIKQHIWDNIPATERMKMLESQDDFGILLAAKGRTMRHWQAQVLEGLCSSVPESQVEGGVQGQQPKGARPGMDPPTARVPC